MNKIKPDFHLPTKIYIKQDILQNIGDIVPDFGSRVIILSTAPDFEAFSDAIEQTSNKLKENNINCLIYDELPESPNTEDVDTAVSYLKKTNCDLIIGFGGVESLNSARAVALLMKNYLFSYDLFSRPGLSYPPLPLITVPAYPVMGFEIAPVFYLEEIYQLSKKVYFNLNLYPVATIVDSAISQNVPSEKIMKMSIGTLAIAVESIISRENNDIINTYALKSIDMIFRNLALAYSDPGNSAPRQALAAASIMSGVAFSISFLSVTAAISLALVSKTKHDLESLMCVILPHIMEFNLTSSPGKYVQMSKVMGEQVKDITVIEAAIKAVEGIRKLQSDVDIPQRLSYYDVSKAVFRDVADLAVTYPFIENTPRDLTVGEIETILLAAY